MTVSADLAGSGLVVAVEGLSALRGFDEIPASIKRAAYQAVNKAADRARTASARRTREQVNFPASYLSGSNSRLTVTERARADSIQATITGRFRATSLARFAKNRTPNRKGGVRVEVAPGFAKLMRRAFIIRLRSGNSDELGNVGLAIRLKPGERVQNKRVMVPLKPGSNVYLLYGPGVDSVFRSVAAEIAPETEDFLEAEFLRLLDLGATK